MRPSCQPPVKILLHKLIIRQMRISGADAVKFLRLPRRQHFTFIQTPGRRQQALTPQQFIDARYAAGKIMGRIKNHGIGIRQFRIPCQPFRRYGIRVAKFRNLFQHPDGGFCPHGPLPQKSADYSASHTVVTKGRQQIVDDVVVIARVQRNVAAS